MKKYLERLTACSRAVARELAQGLIQFGVAMFALPAKVPTHV